MAYHGVLYSHYTASCNRPIIIWKKINKFEEIELAMHKIKEKVHILNSNWIQIQF